MARRSAARAPRDFSPRTLGLAAIALVLVAYAGLQLLLTRSSVNFLWWQAESTRQLNHFRAPKAPTAAAATAPTWQEWVPTAMTAVLITAALIGLSVALARSGRGMWALLAAALPLVPTELVPGTWAPPLANTAAYALVFPPGATEPDTLWAWLEAGLQGAAILLPTVVVGRMMSVRRPRVWTSEVVGRLGWPFTCLVVALAWRVAVGATPDWTVALRTSLYFAIGGLVISGALRWWLALASLALLPALAGGVITWTTDVSGQALVVTDPSAWRFSLVAFIGAAWVSVQPFLRSLLSKAFGVWKSALVEESGETSGDPDPEVPEPVGGRHRA